VSTFKRGRPALSPDETSADVHLTVPASLYDRIYTEAATDRISVPEFIRQIITRELRNPKSEN
jgi:hypothetical protein